MGNLQIAVCNCFGESSGTPGKSNLSSNLQRIKTHGLEEDDLIVSDPNFPEKSTNDNYQKKSPLLSGKNSSSNQVMFSKNHDIVKLDPSDFLVEKNIGKGAFGKVLLVRLKNNKNKLYAMKVMKKQDVTESNLVENIRLEREIMEKGNSPFLVELFYAFQSKVNFYFVMEFIPGGDLFVLLRKQRKFPEEAVRFYAVEVILALEYLHSKMKIIYRDLKPENIMLTKEGHIKIIDFGLAKATTGSTNTFAGTPEYLAPEILANKGHNQLVDLWSLGILIFEMATGRPPFTCDGRNFGVIERLILENKPNFPSYLSKDLVDLSKKLLVTDPLKRLGSKSFADLKSHPFFSVINWAEAQERKLKPPFSNTSPFNMKRAGGREVLMNYKESPGEENPYIEGITFNQNTLDNQQNTLKMY